MKNQTLFQHLKEYINSQWVWNVTGEFSTKHMRERIGKYETLTTYKQINNNPNYTLHCYLGYLRELGCITRVKRGRYKINGPIPEWFGSYHFQGLKGKLDHPSNFYWNSLPTHHKVNPWSNIRVGRLQPKMSLVTDAELFAAMSDHRQPTTTNVNNSLESRITTVQEQINKQIEQLQELKNTLIELQAEADERNEVELRYVSEYVDRIYEVTYLGNEYRIIHTYNSDDIYDEQWKVDNYVDEISSIDIAEYLISWVKENCK